MRASVIAAVLGVSLFACNDPSSRSSESPSPPTSASAASPAPFSSATPAASAKAAPAVWSGSYASKPGPFYVYDGGEWKGVHFRGDDASVGLGDGTLSLTLDPAAPAFHGTGDGALGDVVVTGAFDAKTGEVSFSVTRKDPKDGGFTGTGVGHLAEKTLSGTMRLSRGDAHVIREATFTLAPAP